MYSKGYSKCPPMPHIYRELNCKPIRNKCYEPCDIAYKCPSPEDRRDKCLYKGVYYEDREYIPVNVLRPCSFSCFCEKSLDSKFVCAQGQCQEVLPGCIAQTSIESCCPYDVICGKKFKFLFFLCKSICHQF